MASKYPLFLAAAWPIPLLFAACGGGSSDAGDDEVIVPEGEHHGYVVSKVSVPTTSMESASYAIDIGSSTSAKPDGNADNVLGNLLVSLRAFQFDLQTPITTALDTAAMILLVDFQTADLANSSAAGLTVKFGAMPNPAACTDAADTTCGHHLTGAASFQLAADSPADPEVGGKIVGGAFSGGPGDITVRLTLGGSTPSTLHLLHARVRAAGISETGISTLTLGGAVTDAELRSQLGPAILAQVTASIARDCTGTATPPGCGCASATSIGGLAVTLLDVSPQDCVISQDELFNNPTVKSLLTLDSCSQDSCTTADSYSIAVRSEAVKATFPM